MGWQTWACMFWINTNLLLLLVIPGSEARERLPNASPDYTIYHTKDGVLKSVQDIVAQCPSIMKISTLSEGGDDYNATLSVVTVERTGLPEDQSGKLRLLLDFGQHGRELICSEIALRLLSALCEGGPSLRQLAGKAGLDAEQIEQVLNGAVLQIIPMENVRGRERVEAGELCERKNGRGVDPNRNWAVHWGHKEKDYDPKEEYPGTHPFSEPEALMVRRVAEELQPHVWLNVHSGMQALFMPYDHKGVIPEGASAEATLSMLHQINAMVCDGACAVGSGGKSVGYLAHGTATDYMYDALHVPISMTWEVYGDSQASYYDCFRMFNPLTRDGFEATVEKWVAGVLAMISILPDHPDMPAAPADLAVQDPAKAEQPQPQSQQQEGEGESAADRMMGERRGGAEGGPTTAARQHEKAAAIAAALRGKPSAMTAGSSSLGSGEGGAGRAEGEAELHAGRGSNGSGRGGWDGDDASEEEDEEDDDDVEEEGDWGVAGGVSARGEEGGMVSRKRLDALGAGVSSVRGALARPGWHPLPAHLPATVADWEAVGVFLIVVGVMVGGYVASGQRQVRYALHRWGIASRRSDIPL